MPRKARRRMKSGEARTARGLLIGPFPPPIGGDTVLTDNLWKSRYWGAHGIALDRIDTSPRAGVRVLQEGLGARDTLRGAGIYARFVGRLGGADFVLLWGNSRFIVTLGVLLALTCKARRKPLFIKPFGGSLPGLITRLPFVWRRLVVRALGGWPLILPETRLLEREMGELLEMPNSRLVLLPNFLPDSSFREAPPARGFSGKCAFFGQVKREKGVFDIIDALGGQPGLSCDFYGPILERDRLPFLSRISKSSNLAYRGALDPARVSAAMGSYDVLLLPTFHIGEGYPAVILEAFAAGIAVVATNWRSIPELVEDGVRGLLIPPGSPPAIRAALARLAADPDLYERVSRGGFQFVKSLSEKSVIEGILIPKVREATRARSSAARQEV